MKFSKKPIIIEAFKWTADSKQEDYPIWLIRAMKKQWGEPGSVVIIYAGSPHVKMLITTLEGESVARRGDYIIQGVKKELYPCNPDIFEMTYEKVEG